MFRKETHFDVRVLLMRTRAVARSERNARNEWLPRLRVFLPLNYANSIPLLDRPRKRRRVFLLIPIDDKEVAPIL